MVVLRPISPEDHAFIYATWLRQLWFAKSNLTTLSKTRFMNLHHKKIEVAIHSSEGKVACLEDDRSFLLGYRVGEFMYVKKAFRGQGIEDALR